MFLDDLKIIRKHSHCCSCSHSCVVVSCPNYDSVKILKFVTSRLSMFIRQKWTETDTNVFSYWSNHWILSNQDVYMFITATEVFPPL